MSDVKSEGQTMKLDFRRVSLLAAGLLVYWLAASSALWRFYDIGPLINGGHFTRNHAISIVIKMGFLVTLLTSAAWIWSTCAIKSKTIFGIWWSAASRTLAILFVYWFVVFLRRQLWTSRQGINDDAMFLPFIGHINAVFFSEFGWLLFLVAIIPSMGFVSGILFSVEARLARKAQT